MSKLLSDCEIASAQLRNAKASGNQTGIVEWGTALDDLRRQVFSASDLISVTPKVRHLDLQWQLSRNEQVHPTSIRGLRKNRCAVAGMTKSNKSLLLGRTILVGVFEFHTKANIDKNRRYYVDTFPGDIEFAKNSSPRPIEELNISDEEAPITALYTISSVFSRSGEELVRRLPSDNFFVTESPIRALFSKYRREEIHEEYKASGGETAVREMIVDYLAASARGEEAIDNATFFHVKNNGATLAGVHVNDLDDWVKSDPRKLRNEPIVNYAYASDVQVSNIDTFAGGNIAAAEALQWDRAGISSVPSAHLAPKLLAV